MVSVCKGKDLSCQRYHICEINNIEALVIWNDKFDLHTKRVTDLFTVKAGEKHALHVVAVDSKLTGRGGGGHAH